MKILTSVLKDREIQNYIQENEDYSFEYLKNSFNLENIYNYVVENVATFIIENNSKFSYDKIRKFAKDYTLTILNEAASVELLQDLSGRIVEDFIDKGFIKQDAILKATAKVSEFLKDHPEIYQYDDFLKSARRGAITDLAKMLDGEGFLNSGKRAVDVLRSMISNRSWEDDGVLKKITKLKDFDIASKHIDSFYAVEAAKKAAADVAKKAADDVERLRRSADVVMEPGFFGKITKTLSNNWDTAVHAVASTSRGKLLLGATAGVVTILGGAAAWYKSSTSEQNEAASIGTSVVDNLEKGNDVAAVKVVDNAVGDLDTSELVETSYFKSFISFCDSSFEKLSSTSSDLWDRAKELASEHPYAAAAILIFSAIGIARMYSKKGSSGIGVSTSTTNAKRPISKSSIKKRL